MGADVVVGDAAQTREEQGRACKGCTGFGAESEVCGEADANCVGECERRR
jgi:hypothetical protein